MTIEKIRKDIFEYVNQNNITLREFTHLLNLDTVSLSEDIVSKQTIGKKTTAKVNAMWYFVAEYLEMLKHTGAKYDEEFCRRLKSLLDYVYGKNELPTEFGDIADEYVVYEVEV